MAHIKLQFNLPISIMREDSRYIAYTPALDLATSGKTYTEARKRFEEALYLFFEEIVKAGTLEKVLKDYGWKKIRSQWRPPIVVSQEMQEVNLAV